MILTCPFCDSPIKVFYHSCKAIYECGTEKRIGSWKQSPQCKAKSSLKDGVPPENK